MISTSTSVRKFRAPLPNSQLLFSLNASQPASQPYEKLAFHPMTPKTPSQSIQAPLLKMTTRAPSGPYKLVTVNTAPERAKVIIGRVVEAVREMYTIDYVANAESMSDLLFSFGYYICSALSRFLALFWEGGFEGA
jgi:hypothetical protein